MDQHLEIRQVLPLVVGEWYISYTTLAPCGCRLERHKLIIKQKSKPSDKTIHNAIKNQ
jgi:hypothetical protein